MSDEVIVNLDVLKADAENVWEEASDRLVSLRDEFPVIASPDYCLWFDPTSMDSAYRRAVRGLRAYLSGGSHEFLEFEKRLLEAAIIYGESHGMSAADIAALEAEIDV